jgi:hypothetical protein
VADGRVWNLHGLVVLRNDRLVLERYFEGEDRVRGIGEVGLFSPGIFWSGLSLNRSGWKVQHLQMYS